MNSSLTWPRHFSVAGDRCWNVFCDGNVFREKDSQKTLTNSSERLSPQNLMTVTVILQRRYITSVETDLSHKFLHEYRTARWICVYIFHKDGRSYITLKHSTSHKHVCVLVVRLWCQRKERSNCNSPHQSSDLHIGSDIWNQRNRTDFAGQKR